MKLKKISSVEIIPIGPFNFDATFHKPDHFTSGDNYWEPGIRWQAWNWQGKQLGLKFVNASSMEEPRVVVEIYYQCPLDDVFVSSLIDEVRYRYNLDLDMSAFYGTFANDQVLGPIIKRWRGMRPGHPSSLYEYARIARYFAAEYAGDNNTRFHFNCPETGRMRQSVSKTRWCNSNSTIAARMPFCRSASASFVT